MKIQFSKVTNTEGLLNKTFSIDLNGQVKNAYIGATGQ